ncbi:MAG: VWA domain-containing protein, partial [Erysipelothrix sp.]|nr:VWA domain-containing protein [Erysipelothrix sp.]
VLVLDQSGSMAWSFGTEIQGDRITIDSTAYGYRDNPGLVVRYGDNYYPLTVTRSGFLVYIYNYTFVDTTGTTINFTSLNGEYHVFRAKTSRTEALKNVVTTFVNNVQANAENNEVDHRISMVGFGSGPNQHLNTEILTTPIGNPVNYDNANETNYKNSLMSITTYRTRIQAAIDAIDAVGATRSDLGMEMATKVFANNPLNQGEERNRVIVMLTDGSPTSSNGFETDVANAAINYSRTLKNSTDSEGYGATVYTIGIFDGANPSGTSRENRYMNYVSSNYPNASNLGSPGDRVTEGNYYLTAQNQSDLENIFESISETISSPTIEAGEGTVVVDQLTPQLQLPAGFTADDVEVSVYSYTYHGLVPNYSSTSWEKDTSPLSSIDVTLNDDGRIEVTGFNYQENFVANDSSNGDPRGKKIVIEFTAKIKEDFIGGNQVLTNESNSGFYLPGESDATEVFEQPMIDVPLRLNIVGQDAGQYYGTQTPANQLILNNSKSYTIGSKEYEFDGKNNQYVNITYDVYLPGGTDPVYTYSILAGASGINKSEIDILLGLSETGTLTYKATVTPAQDGTIGEIVFTNNPQLYVWYPKFKLTNETIYLGESTDISDRYEFVKWAALASEPGAIKPTYYTPGNADIKYEVTWESGTKLPDEGEYKPSEDSTFRIDPVVKKYPDCKGDDCWASMVHEVNTVFDSENHNQTFTIFVETLKLTITKEVPEDQLDEYQSFIFNITSKNGYKKTVVIQGNGSVTLVGLAVGEYTVVEDENWSYRYTATHGSQNVVVNRENKEGQAKVKNTKADKPWLSGEHFAINRYKKEEVIEK